jgi:hypothetical protein
MFDSALRHPSTFDQRFREDWRTDQRILALQAELESTRQELDVLRATTAEMLTAVLEQLYNRPSPVAEVPAQIRELADLREPADGEPVEDPITGEVDVIDVTNRESLHVLDRRFRWMPSRQARD